MVKIAGWGVMNVFKDLPLKEAFFPWWSPPIFLCCVVSLIVPTHKGPLCEPVNNVPPGGDKMWWDIGLSQLKHQGLHPQMSVDIAQGITQLEIIKLGISQQFSALLSQLLMVESV